MTKQEKLRYYADLSDRTAIDVMASPDTWMHFLDSAAKMYKYNFDDQLLIHAQKPNATACAPIELWNTSFKRLVNRGTKGIALIDDTNTRPRLKYVFDVSDTHAYNKDAPQVGLWELQHEHQDPVLKALAKTYDDVNPASLEDSFRNIAYELALEYYEDNSHELTLRASGSILEDFDTGSFKDAFLETVTSSMAYLMMARCGFNPENYFDEEDFTYLINFDTTDIIHAVGEVTSDLSQQVLRDVELVVKKHEKEKARLQQQVQHRLFEDDYEVDPTLQATMQAELNQTNTIERTDNHEPSHTISSPTNENSTDTSAQQSQDNQQPDQTTEPNSEQGEYPDPSRTPRSGVHPSGRLPATQHPVIGGPRRETSGPIRNDEEVIPANSPQDHLRTAQEQGEPIPTLSRDRSTGRSTDDQGDELTSSHSDSARQGDRPHGLDSGNEHPTSPSGGADTPRADLQRHLGSEPTSETSSQLGTNLVTTPSGESGTSTSQLPPIADNLTQTLSTSSITADEVDFILRDGGNSRKHSAHRIAAHFAKDLSPEDNATYLKDEYLRGEFKYHRPTEGGKGYQFGNTKTAVWWNEDGIKIGRGTSAISTRDFTLILWEQAAERVKQLYDSGHYVNHDVLEEALHNEYTAVASHLLHIYRDDLRDLVDVPEQLDLNLGWPDAVAQVTELLKDPDQRELLFEEMLSAVEILENFEGGRLRRWHDPYLAANDLEKLDIAPVGFPIVTPQGINAMRFITQDEIDSVLTHGSSFSEGKMRIFSHFLANPTASESVNFLKDEYGTGGRTWLDGGENHEPGKGITLDRPGCEKVNLSWPAVVKRTKELIHSGKYLSQSELDRIPTYEKLRLARTIKSFFSSPVDGLHEYSPFSKDLDFHYPKQDDWDAIHAFMDSPETVADCLTKMQYLFDHTPKEDRYYNQRQYGLKQLQDFHDGKYTLFPNLERIQLATTAWANRQQSNTSLQQAETNFSALLQSTASVMSQSSQQISLFDITPVPTLPSVAEQQSVIEQSVAIADEIAPEPVKEAAPELPSMSDNIVTPTPEVANLNIGDTFQIGDDVWAIQQLDEGEIHLKKMGEPSVIDSFDNLTLLSHTFKELLEDGKITALAQVPAVQPVADANETPQPLSARLTLITAIAHKIPPESSNGITLYKLGDFYEAYEKDADTLATHLDFSVITDNSYPSIPVKVVGFPADKLEEHIQKIQTAAQLNVTVASLGSDGTINVDQHPHPALQPTEWEQYVTALSQETAAVDSYTEPFVVIENSESPHFIPYEHLFFRDADEMFKTVEASERAERIQKGKVGGYHKTSGAIFYKKNPSDTTLSTYEFRYDIGDYPENRSGLYNHINNFWTNTDHALGNGRFMTYSKEQVDDIRTNLVPLLAQYQHQTQELQTPTPDVAETSTGSTNDATDMSDTAPIPDEPSFPPPVFFVDWDGAQFDFDLSDYPDRATLGYNKDGVEYTVGHMGMLTYTTETTNMTPWGQVTGATNIPQDIWEQMNAYRNGELTDEQVRNNYLAVFEAVKSQGASVQDREHDTPDTPEPSEVPDPSLVVRIREEMSQRGYAVSDDLVAEAIIESEHYGAGTDYQGVADFIENELLIDVDELTPIEQLSLDPPKQATIPQSPVEFAELYVSGALDGLVKDVSINYVPGGLGMLHYTNVLGKYTSSSTVKTVDAEYIHSLFQPTIADVPATPQQETLFRAEPATTATVTSPTPKSQPKTPPPANFVITDPNLGTGTAKAKYQDNILAIQTLKILETENRYATPDEMQSLSKYVGWGSLPEVFGSQNTSWRNEYTQLKELLTPSEYESANGSVLNAHYTSPTVITAIYDTVEKLGFKTGNLLEPAMGVGNFFGMLPESMKEAKLYGVELDSISARISKQLYPSATIKEMGYEKTDYPDAFFDVAVGNVPFGNYGVNDKRYNKHKHQIHDYFFAKTLDQVRPGGIVAFVTSKGTLDKKNPEVRKYLAQRAELLGAVRLPNTAFKANAGTEVTSDIIFLQKRDRMIDVDLIDPKFDWVHLDRLPAHEQNSEPVTVNRYFVDNPHMILGEMTTRMGQFGPETTCNPIERADLADQLSSALSYVEGEITVPELDDLDGGSLEAIPADPTVKNYSYTVVDSAVYFRENSMMYPVEQPAATLERIKGMIGLRDCVRELIDLQYNDRSELAIKAMQDRLNTLYDRFTKKHGLINASANNRAFATGQFSDSSYYLLCSLENLDEDGKLKSKGDMFTKRTIKQKVVITHVDTSTEALAVSMGEKARVDMALMQSLTGKDEDTIYQELEGVIYKDFYDFEGDGKCDYLTADEFLSGNVRHKLEKYQQALDSLTGETANGSAASPLIPIIQGNITALEKAMPKALEAHEINLRLGSTWIEPKYVQAFMHELLKTSEYNKGVYQVQYHTPTGQWQVSGKGKSLFNDIPANVTYGTKRMNAYQILDDSLNLKDTRVYDYITDAEGRQKRELNKKETMLAQQKQEQIKQEFKNWIFKDPQRRETLVKQYNEKFNSSRPREYDGSHITFSGISPEIKLRPHQLNAIAHILYGGNTLLAHEVGAGKTFEIVAAAMESKRLGLVNKNMIAVPNHLTEQWASEWLRLYPSANLLVATKKDFEKRNRKKFIAKIATGDYDAVIIGHTQLEKIPLSPERQERIIREQIDEITDGIQELKGSNGDNFTVKQLAKTRKALETKLEKLADGKQRDDVIDFEQLGIDKLYVDESHYFKDL